MSEVGTDGHTREASCLNCGTALQGDYCHACGQHAHVHRTIGAFFHDLLHGVLHFEGKTWRTLALLVWRPGELTRRYIDGERAKFVSPIALFLFSVFIMFAVISLSGDTGNTPDISGRRDLPQEIARVERELATLQKDREAAVQAGKPTAKIDEQISDTQTQLTVMRGVATGSIKNTDELAKLDPTLGSLSGPVKKVASDPELAYYKFKSNAYKFSWALIPISAPFLWLLFPFSRRFRFYDHIVFVTYSLAFMTMLFVIILLAGPVGLSAFVAPALLIPPIHIYRQLRGAYGVTRGGALWRTALLLVFGLVSLMLFAVLILAPGVL